MVVLFAAYVAVSIALARRFALLDDEAVEAFEIELPTYGHHIALYHHASKAQRFVEPVIICHGLGANRFNMDFGDDGSGSDRISLARTLSRSGLDAWVLELRGRGRAKVPRRADWSIDDEVREDLPTAIETVLDLTGAEQVFWVGHSKGGILQYLLQADQPPVARKVKALAAIGSPATFKYQRRWIGAAVRWTAFWVRTGRPIPLSLIAKLGIPLANVVMFVGNRTVPIARAIDTAILRRIMASLAADIAPGVIRQFAAWFRAGAMTRKDGTKYEDSFSKITLPLLLIAGSKDFIAPPESLQYLYDRASSADKTLMIAGPEGGCKHDYGHGDLVIGRDAPEEIFPKVAEWLGAHATSKTEAPEDRSGSQEAMKP